MVSYHTTPELLRLVTGMNCPGVAYHTIVRNQTDDGKNLTVVTVGADSPRKLSAKDKLRIMLTFGIHGREYFASEVALRYVPRGHLLPSIALCSPRIAPDGRTNECHRRYITTLCDGSTRSTQILDKVAFAMVPVMNPSGRSRTDETDTSGDRTVGLDEQQCSDRRKNANLVDLNRNFDVSWDLADGASSSQSQEDYRGPSPMSETETWTASNLADDFEPDMYIDLHTGTIAMYRPWNYQSSEVDGEAAANMTNFMNGIVDGTYEDGTSIWDGSALGVDDWRNPDAGVGGVISYLASGTCAASPVQPPTFSPFCCACHGCELAGLVDLRAASQSGRCYVPEEFCQV